MSNLLIFSKLYRNKQVTKPKYYLYIFLNNYNTEICRKKNKFKLNILQTNIHFYHFRYLLLYH